MPVPTAVPPSGSSRTRGRTPSSRSAARTSVAAYPPNSWPSITGVASIRWVRPDFTTSPNSSALAARLARSRSSAGCRSSTTARAAATWIAVGNVSLLDWLALTWSLGWTPSPASGDSTSFMFMFELVPEPVWKTSTGNWSPWSPEATAAAAPSTAPAVAVVDHPELAVGAGRRLLDQRERADQPGLERGPADGEVLDGSLGLGLPQRVGGDAHLAHGVVLDPVVVHLSQATGAPGPLRARQEPAARIRLLRGWCSSSASPRCSSTGGT